MVSLIGIVALVAIAVGPGTALAFFGYRIHIATVRLWGFFLGALIGILVGLLIGDPLMMILAACTLGVFGAVVAKVVLHTLLFVNGLVVGGLLGYLLGYVVFHHAVAFVFPIALGIIGGILAVKFHRPFIIISSAMVGAGLLSGPIAIVLLYTLGIADVVVAGLQIWVLLAALAVWYQFKSATPQETVQRDVGSANEAGPSLTEESPRPDPRASGVAVPPPGRTEPLSQSNLETNLRILHAAASNQRNPSLHQLLCPQCSEVVTVTIDTQPVCSMCGFS